MTDKPKTAEEWVELIDAVNRRQADAGQGEWLSIVKHIIAQSAVIERLQILQRLEKAGIREQMFHYQNVMKAILDE